MGDKATFSFVSNKGNIFKLRGEKMPKSYTKSVKF